MSPSPKRARRGMAIGRELQALKNLGVDRIQPAMEAFMEKYTFEKIREARTVFEESLADVCMDFWHFSRVEMERERYNLPKCADLMKARRWLKQTLIEMNKEGVMLNQA